MFDEAGTLDLDWVWWGAALGLGVPLLLVLLTELLSSLTYHGNPLAKPVRLLRNWVLPVGAVFALLTFALNSPADQVWVRIAATVFGFLVILLVLSAFNVAIFDTARAGSWRKRMPSIFVSLIRLVLIGVGLALLFSWVWRADVGGLFAALGVTSIVIGLALQNAVGGIISGLLLLFEQPFKLGDWLSVGDVQGEVVEVNWRAVHLHTDRGVQIIPNAQLAGASFTNQSTSDAAFHVEATLTFLTSDGPEDVIDLLTETGNALPMLAEGTTTRVTVLGGGEYRVTIPVAGLLNGERALSLFRSWIWYAARRRKLSLDGTLVDPALKPEHLEDAVDRALRPLRLKQEDRPALLTQGRLLRFAPGEPVQQPGIVPREVYFVVGGTLSLEVPQADGYLEFARAEANELIGQATLTGERTTLRTVAIDTVTVLSLPRGLVVQLVDRRPGLAREISRTLDLRRRQGAAAVREAESASGPLNAESE
ncbi:MAG: mechanosensitive ion channel domain-containing protein [Leucobacter sp.]